MTFVAVCVLVCFGLWAPRLPTLPQRVVRAVSFYFAIEFVLRPLYLIVFVPDPTTVPTLAETLLETPTYAAGINHLSALLVLGQATFLAAIYALVIPFRRHWGLRSIRGTHEAVPLGILYAVSWLARLLTVGNIASASGPGVLVGRLSPLGTAVLAVIILTMDWRSSPRTKQLVVLMCFGELAWSFLDASKTPIVAVLIVLYLDPRRIQQSVRNLVVGAFGAYIAFDLIERLKPHQDLLQGSWLSSGLGDLLLRFDMVNATAIAQQLGPGSYFSANAAGSQMAEAFVPQQLLGAARPPDGQNWAIVMEHVTSGVSLATGPIAEGFAIAGKAGIVASELLLVVCLLLMVWLVSRRSATWLALWAAYVLTSGAFFEQGPIGLAQAVSSGLQASVIAGALLVLLSPRALSARPYRAGQDALATATRSWPGGELG